MSAEEDMIISIPGIGFSCNVFLILGKGKNILVDAGLAETADYVLEEVGKYIDPREVDTIFLTHRHCDHIGGAKALMEATGADILAPKLEAGAIVNGDDTTGARLFGVSIESVPAKAVEEGYVIDTGNGLFKVLSTPGHTIGSAVLYEKDKGILISGDTVFGGGGVGRWDLPTGNYRDLVQSLDRLCELPVEKLYPGHGPSVEASAAESIRASRMGLGGWGI